jgi:moderate conductance mechanosensitive channel
VSPFTSSFASWLDGWQSAWQDGPWNVLLGTPLLITVTVVAGLVVRFVLHRLIDRVTDGIATGRAGLGGQVASRIEANRAGATVLAATAPQLVSLRREQRARTTASVLRSLTTAVVTTVVGLTVLDELTIPVAPLLASAGIVGVAVGFGAQALVKDVISGLFMIVEDQYGVGDTIEIGATIGVVEAVGLRVTQLRDGAGTTWYLRNGEILKVGNRSQGWGNAVLDVAVAYCENVDRVGELLLEVGREIRTDPGYAAAVLDDPTLAGVESVSAGGVVVRLEMRTAALENDRISRELRRRAKQHLDAAGVHVAYSASAVLVTDPGPADPAAGI